MSPITITPKLQSARRELVPFGNKPRYVPKVRACYPLKYRSSSFFHFAIWRACAAHRRASNSRRCSSISSSLAPGWSARMDCQNQRRAVLESSAHWRSPSWAVRGKRMLFISAFTRSAAKRSDEVFRGHINYPRMFSFWHLIPLYSLSSKGASPIRPFQRE